MDDCRDAIVSIYQTPDGRFIETFSVGAQTFENEIPSPAQASRTPAPKVMWDQGLCTIPIPPEPVATVATTEPAIPVTATVSQAVEVSNPGGLLIVGSAFLGLVGIVGLGVAISYAIKPDPTLRLPMPKQTFLLPPPPEVGADYTQPSPWARPHSEMAETVDFAGETKSETGPKQLRISPENIPKFDPLEPIHGTEFDVFLFLVESGLSPRGAEIIEQLWGAKPGNNAPYKAAKDRRDMFARRLSEYQL